MLIEVSRDLAIDDTTRIAVNHELFDKLRCLADYYLRRRCYDMSVIAAQLAASQAFVNHCGIFSSGLLETIVTTIGKDLFAASPSLEKTWAQQNNPKNILHVLNSARPTGGDTRYVWRWIQQDGERTHSVVLTRQRRMDVPQILIDTISSRGGSLHILDAQNRDIIDHARQLRHLSKFADVVVLHLFPDDIIPSLAFAETADLPPIIFINHSDHTFWVGVSTSDIVVHLRECSVTLSTTKRNISPERIRYLPTPLVMPGRTRSVSEAKKNLGLAEGSVILLTIATAFKYEPVFGQGFLDIVSPALRKFKNCYLLAVGPDNSEMWKKAKGDFGDQIVTLGRQSETAQYYEAADIYVDSWPFSSITSMLEAASYGVPVITYCAYGEAAQVLCAGAPGLTERMLKLWNRSDYQASLEALIRDEAYRKRIGEMLKQEVLAKHCGSGWKEYLEKLYASMAKCPRRELRGAVDSVPEKAQIDMLLCQIYRTPQALAHNINYYAQDLPYGRRLLFLIKLFKLNKMFSLSMFFPSIIEKQIRGRMAWCRKVPIAAKLLRSKYDAA